MDKAVMLEVRIVCPDHLKEIIMAELSFLPYEGFWDHADVIYAYIPSHLFSREALSETLRTYGVENNFSLEEMPDVNWNASWEANFHPFELDKEIRVRASFHDPNPDFRLELLINPRMSFGTGHHETTELMLRMMLHTDFQNKNVLDMGSGTGILAIVAEKMGASKVLALDNDEWACENIRENLDLNNCTCIATDYGDLDQLKSLEDGQFDVVLSNITKNINLSLLPELCRAVSMGARLLLSGFLDFDLNDMKRAAAEHGLHFVGTIEKNGWMAAEYTKNEKT